MLLVTNEWIINIFLIFQKEQELKEKLDLIKHNCYELRKELESMQCLEELNNMIKKVTMWVTKLNFVAKNDSNILCSERQRAEVYLEERKQFLETYFFPKLHKLHVEYVEKMVSYNLVIHVLSILTIFSVIC